MPMMYNPRQDPEALAMTPRTVRTGPRCRWWRIAITTVNRAFRDVWHWDGMGDGYWLEPPPPQRVADEAERLLLARCPYRWPSGNYVDGPNRDPPSR